MRRGHALEQRDAAQQIDRAHELVILVGAEIVRIERVARPRQRRCARRHVGVLGALARRSRRVAGAALELAASRCFRPAALPPAWSRRGCRISAPVFFSAPRRSASCWICRRATCSMRGRLDDDVGRDAGALDRAARRRVVERRGEADRAAAFLHRQHGLHRAFAEGSRAEQHGAMIVLQRARRRSPTPRPSRH